MILVRETIQKAFQTVVNLIYLYKFGVSILNIRIQLIKKIAHILLIGNYKSITCFEEIVIFFYQIAYNAKVS